MSKRLSDSASLLTADIWEIIETMDQIKHSTASKYIILRNIFCVSRL